MARDKAAASTSQVKIQEATGLLRRLDASQVLRLFAEVFPNANPKRIGSHIVRMHCQTGRHPDKHPSFNVDVQNGTVQCLPCGYRTRNLLQVFQDCRGWGYAESLTQLQSILNVRLVAERVERALRDLDVHRDTVRLIAWATNTYLQAMYAPVDSTPYATPLLQKAAEQSISWLFTHRKMDPTYVPQLPYGLWPPKDTLQELVEERLEYVANEHYAHYNASRFSVERRKAILECLERLTHDIGVDWVNAIAYVAGHDFSTPARIKLRKPSIEDIKMDHIKMLPGHTPDEPTGFFGLYAPNLVRSSTATNTSKLLCVEGETDTLKIQEGLLSAGVSNWIVVGSGGVANVTDLLHDAGFSCVHLLSDEPTHGKGAMWARERLMSAVKIEAKVYAGWGQLNAPNRLLKDPDEVIKDLGFQYFQEQVLSKDDVFLAAHQWAVRQAIEAGQGLVDVAARMTPAVHYGECLRNPAQFAAYLTSVTETLQLSGAVLRSQIAQGRDDEEGFIARIADTLRQDFIPVEQEQTPRGPVVRMYHRTSRRMLAMPLNDGRTMAATLATITGSVHTYFETRIGLPRWLGSKEDAPSSSVIRDLSKPLAEYLSLGMQDLAQSFRTRADATVLGLGYHRVPDAESKYGVRFYGNFGTWWAVGVQTSEDRVEWQELDGPVHGPYLFLTGAPYSLYVQSIDDLNAGNAITDAELCEAFKEVVKICTFWHWKNDIDTLFAAAILVYFMTPHFHEEGLNLGLQGQTSSGKSTFMAVATGGQTPALRLVDPVLYQTNYSLASITAAFDTSTLLIALEEFSRGGVNNLKTKQYEDLLEMLRQVIYPGGAVITRNMNGARVSRTIRTNVMTTSLEPPSDPQDANRRLELETDKVEGYSDPALRIRQQYTDEAYRKLGRTLNLGTLRCYPKFVAARKLIQEALLTLDPGNGRKVESRFTRNLPLFVPWLAVFGFGWREFMLTFTQTRLDRMEAYAQSTQPNMLFDTLMHANNIRIGSVYTNCLALLSQKDQHLHLNASPAGLYYNAGKGYLVVDWITTTSPGGILYRNEQWRYAPHQLKHHLDQNKFAIPAEKYAELGVKEFLASYGQMSQPHHMTVLNLKALVDVLQKSSQRAALVPQQNREGSNPAADTDASSGLPPGVGLPPSVANRRNLS